MRILLIDDDSALIEVLSRHLVNQRYSVDAVSDGESGWSYATTYSYDLIVLNVMLPKLDGISLCQRLRHEDTTTPIVLLTSEDNSPSKVLGLDAGADDYLVKPIDLEELTARIRALLRRSSANPATVLTWEDLWLNPSTSEVTYKGQPLTLTAKEYALLELFLRENHRIFSIEEILESLWSSAEFPAEATVRSHIRRLRQRLIRAGAPSNLITTSHGRGYSLKPLAEPIDLTAPTAPLAEPNFSQLTDQAKLNTPKVLLAPSEANPSSPSLLLVNFEQSLAQTLTALAANADISTNIASIVQARERLFDFVAVNSLPDLILLKLSSETASHKTSQTHAALRLLEDVTHRYPALPVVVIVDRSAFSQQLKVVRQGGICLPTATPEQILTAVKQTLELQRGAKVLAIGSGLLHLLPSLVQPWNLQVHAVNDPHLIWKSLELFKPEALLLEVEIPGVNGMELCQLLRSDPLWQHLPVLLLSSHSNPKMQHQAFAAGADDYLTKPIDATALAIRLLNRIKQVRLYRR